MQCARPTLPSAAPAQTAAVNGAKILAAATVPKKRGDWTIELSPMTRIDAWKVPTPKVGDRVAAVAYSFKDEKVPPSRALSI